METTAKEKPVIFKAEMVNAILEGRKTQTRRLPTIGTSYFASAGAKYFEHGDFDKAWVDGPSLFGDVYLKVPCHVSKRGECKYCDEYGLEETVHRLHPRYQKGDVLWVRETWAVHGALYDDLKPSKLRYNGTDKDWNPNKDGCHKEGDAVWYRAASDDIPEPDNGCRKGHRGKWRPSIFMPDWASRIKLLVKDVRIERVQEISEADAKAEGIHIDPEWHGDKKGLVEVCYGVDDKPRNDGPVEAFKDLWESINGKRKGGNWGSNPWVIVTEFERLTND